MAQGEFERRFEHLLAAVPNRLVKTEREKERLHIVYVMTWTGVCGGSKIILEHANHLTAAGHEVTVVTHGTFPDWFPLKSEVRFIAVPEGEIPGEYIPPCDVIVATYWREIYECVETRRAPVVYFEQGDFHLFAREQASAGLLEHIDKQILTADFYLTVSHFAAETIAAQYQRAATVIPNAVDKSIFFPPEQRTGARPLLCAIGAMSVAFKCIPLIFAAVEAVRSRGYDVDLVWITPENGSFVLSSTTVLSSPPQSLIGDTLRAADIFICASLYESFCLPVLEAFSCGTAVITTDNGGVRDFVRAGENALMVRKNNAQDIADAVILLIENLDILEKIAAEALKTAAAYDWGNVTEQLVGYYREVARNEVENREERTDNR